MKFKDKLETLPDETYIKVRTEKGSSYFYIGKVKDMKTNLVLYGSQMKTYWRAKILREQRLIDAETCNATMAGYVNSNKFKGLSFDGFIDYMKSCLERALIARERKEDAQVKLMTAKALSVRSVIECNPSDVNLPTAALNIIVEGYENGRLWLVSEIGDKEGMMALSEGENVSEGDDEIQSED